MNTRYSRQALFLPIGEEGQQRLLASKVFIVGMGALGTSLANHFARAGVGRIYFIDRDYVELSNMNRQMLFDEDDVAAALPKAIAARDKLRKINSGIEIEGFVGDLTMENAEKYMRDADVVVDGTDNFETRLLINDVCYKLGIPYVYGGVVAAQGISALFWPGHTACLRCFMAELPGGGETCDTVGVIGPAVHMVTAMQAAEVLKLLVGDEEALRQTLFTFQLWPFSFREMRLPKARADCPTCQLGEYPALFPDYDQLPAVLCGRGTVQISRRMGFDLLEWEERLERVADVKRNPYLLTAQLPEGEQLVLFPEGRVFIQNTTDPARAKTLYAKYIGG